MEADRNQFLKLLQAHFDAQELADLCFRLDIVHDDLAGENRAARMRSLIMHCERHGITAELTAACRRLRQHISWPALSESDTQALDVSLDLRRTAILPGDRLDTIIGRANDGDASQWRTVADKNRLSNPRKLQPGQRLAPDTIVGIGWSFPPRVAVQGGLALTGTDSELDESIALILMTAPGERLMHPGFGCRLNELRFGPKNEQTLEMVQKFVREAVQRWETRVTILDVGAAFRHDVPYEIVIAVDYEVKATGENRRTRFVFTLMEGSQRGQNGLYILDD